VEGIIDDSLTRALSVLDRARLTTDGRTALGELAARSVQREH